MKDGTIRTIIKRIALLCYSIDLKSTRGIKAFRGEPLYRLNGFCNQCGACCKSPMIPVFSPFFFIKPIHRIIRAWHRWVNAFEYVGEDRKSQILIFRCTHWDPITKMCDSYNTRPGMCRDYPRNLIYSPNPTFLEPCSYYAIDKNADRMRAALKDLNLPPEKLEALEQKLYVRDPVPPDKP